MPWRFHLPVNTFPSRNTQTLPEPVTTSSGEGLPTTSRMPVSLVLIFMTTTFVAATRLWFVSTSAVPFCVRTHRPCAHDQDALASGDQRRSTLVAVFAVLAAVGAVGAVEAVTAVEAVAAVEAVVDGDALGTLSV